LTTAVAAAGTKHVVGKDDVAEVEPTWELAGHGLFTCGNEIKDK